MFLPTTRKEMETLGWDRPDIIIVTGDSYIDSPFIGAALIGRVLMAEGFKTAIIAQPEMSSDADIARLGEPYLFWGVTGGSVDSLVANYTASKKRRKKDDFTPGGINNRRPDRAVIQYTNLIRRYFKNTAPIVLGGIEASLRRIAHFDFWSDAVRKSVLFDAKADFLVYGMGEKTTVALARALQHREDPTTIPGLCYISKEKIDGFIELPSFEEAKTVKQAFITMFDRFYRNTDPITAKGLFQKQDSRYLVQNPPSGLLNQEEMDTIYDLPFERELHPFYKKQGTVTALDTIRFSIPTHRGCYGECHFCAITVHQGRTVTSRSEASVLNEAKKMTRHPAFKGVILDVSGPTANMYGFECRKKLKKGACPDKRCLFPETCNTLSPDHSRLIRLLRKLKTVSGVKHVFTASGIRYDLIFNDKKNGYVYLTEVIENHVSGQLKIAPEHTEDQVLAVMGKPSGKSLLEFKNAFDRINQQTGKKQFLTYYFIAAHPGCKTSDMQKLKTFVGQKLKMTPEQVQIFTPTPSTWSSLMYYTGINPFTQESLFVEKTFAGREKQKRIVTEKKFPGRKTPRKKKKS